MREGPSPKHFANGAKLAMLDAAKSMPPSDAEGEGAACGSQVAEQPPVGDRTR